MLPDGPKTGYFLTESTWFQLSQCYNSNAEESKSDVTNDANVLETDQFPHHCPIPVSADDVEQLCQFQLLA